ncbi:MAG TPA: methionine adenosyltransferase domain-containing protein [Patescibacteria group bacterium]|jgi:S-adenosylmethionine synthetase|nr:methionine adenosyltransferase domain-containing protein [Patescibacteria group bacterium]
MTHYRTAESVSPKHPDKLCDQISDAILDAYLRGDPEARVAVETVGGHGKLFITGEVRSTSHPALEPIIRRIAGDSIDYTIHLVKQSREIAQGVDTGGAGDQGIMIGYACDETPELLPLEVVLARNLNQYLYALWPHDGKTQVTLRGTEIDSIVASFQHAPHDELEQAVKQWARTQPYVSACFVKGRNGNPTLLVNPAGDWQVGGFDADAGLTGRKLVVDNYGPRIPIGGGCFSGKDPSKVDRSAAYMARYIARDYITRFQAHEVIVRLAYAIGYDKAVEATAIVDGVEKAITGYDLSPRGIVDTLNLKRPQYERTARWGHFGHPAFSWEYTAKEKTPGGASR